MRTLPLVVLSALVLSACDAAGNVNSGPLALGIVAGNNQTATAGEDRLPDPVVGKMVRQPDGGITFRLVTPAYAQEGTVVNGSPVPGAVVCAVTIEGQLEAFTPCTNTDSDGNATFFFAPGTEAGIARAEIRGTVDDEPAVFDTVFATVKAGEVADGEYFHLAGFAMDTLSGYALCDIRAFRDQYGNEIWCEPEVEGGAAFLRRGDHLGGNKAWWYVVRSPEAKAGDTFTVDFYRTDTVEIVHSWLVTVVDDNPLGMVEITHQYQ